MDALEATASPLGPLRGGKETQLPRCLDAASGHAETRCRRTATPPPASTGSLQRSLSTPARATCMAGRAQLNGSSMEEAGEGAPSPAPHPNCQTPTSKAEVSTWLRTGTFYLALTVKSSCIRKLEQTRGNVAVPTNSPGRL